MLVAGRTLVHFDQRVPAVVDEAVDVNGSSRDYDRGLRVEPSS